MYTQSSENFLSFRAKTFQSYNLFILRLILLKPHMQASLLESFPMMYASSKSGEKSGSSHLLGVVAPQADQTVFVPELSKAVTFWSYVLSW